MDVDRLAAWFEINKRAFPWRETKDPYRIWISEVMLQQTQAQVVIPYFDRWIEKFPTIEALSEAEKDEVVKAWEGLGYYSRARNLHRGAKDVVSRFGGKIPATKEELLSIPGIGEYTAGAILSFAFSQRSPAIDGNVIRVITRFFRIREEISIASTKRAILKAVEEILPKKNSHIVSEALIELGATVCKKKPSCIACPVKKGCLAYLHGEEGEIPFIKKRAATVFLRRAVFAVEQSGKLLIRREVEKGIMQDLYALPSIEISEPISGAVAVALLKEKFGIDAGFQLALPEVEHTYTRFRVTLNPVKVYAQGPELPAGFQWVSFPDLKEFPFSSGYRRILRLLNVK
ncbi:A/G-specific adenine glycosylase [Estrella lausannensis]|uniref:Adenine DNA glycosylase n=1 Tax=Estrella lausannensis TaxID=483423 RepID=A0A0H5DMS7_9BACT|nr:A/G-specific adenine glycosylase [Estrella lausannensis]CRX37456.1 A/G-specific adenine glycosylase MutY [Estrella lausannensis]